MNRLNTRAKLFGVATIIFAITTGVICVLFGLMLIGVGTWLTFAAKGSVPMGAAVGLVGLTGAVVGFLFAILKGVVGLLIVRGRKLGLFLGLILAGLGVFSGFGGAWAPLLWGLFGIWALWTSRSQFR